MKIKDNQFKPGRMEKEEVKRKKEMEKVEKEAARKKRELDNLEKEAARKKREMDKVEKDATRKEMDAAKKEYNLEKSRISLERLQLNWIKWNITCIALGFTAYKFYYSRVHDGENPIGREITGREIGIFLICLGFISLLVATLQHKKSIEKLRLQYVNMHYSLSLRLSYVIMGFSVLILFMVIFRA